MNLLAELQAEVRRAADQERGRSLQRFFKTGEGQYGAGDIFLGLTVPQSRAFAKKYTSLELEDILQLLHTGAHEERLIALFLLIQKYQQAETKTKQLIYEQYLLNTRSINNWDLVDSSAGPIVGEQLKTMSTSEATSVLQRLATSHDLWERRIAIIATFASIMDGRYELTFFVSDILLNDHEDLIHKAVGWMLREVGKRCSEEVEEDYLRTRYKTMPRTMLRYAIERFPEEKRQAYLKGTI